MLSSLHIQNLVIVDEQIINFAEGLTVITGETGAGKSILLNALNLILGQRANADLVRNGEKRGSITADFNIHKHPNILDWLQKNELDDAKECLIRRTLSKEGPSKAFINSIGVSLNQLKEFGELLIDIHNQNEHYSLLSPHTQMLLLDEYAQTTELTKEINSLKHQHQELSQQVAEIENNNKTQEEKKVLLNHFIQELADLELNQEELDNIEDDYKLKSNAKSLIQTLSGIHEQLDSEEGINQKLNHLVSEINTIVSFDKKLDQPQTLINDAQIQVQEAIYSLSDYLSSLEIDENTLQLLEEKINQLHNLANKHNCPLTQLIKKEQELNQQLEQFTQGSEHIANLKENLKTLQLSYQEKAKTLSTQRNIASEKFAKKITNLIQTLGMADGVFAVKLTPKEGGLHLNGLETVSFIIQTNAGSKMQPLNKIASGGELSRISLAITVVSANFYALPTVIFDEVDVGISGAIAEIVGQKLQELAQNIQVICITHLPQVAALGQQHLKVIKQTVNNTTRTKVFDLNKDEKVDEIARLLGGVNISENTKSVAKELISAGF
jgi:DNA repair protein RecN (Recombination protein N)